MNIEAIISNVGFPIACVIGLAWYIKYVTDKHEKEIADLRNSYNDTIADLRNSLDNNTRAITELVFYLKEGEKKHG